MPALAAFFNFLASFFSLADFTGFFFASFFPLSIDLLMVYPPEVKFSNDKNIIAGLQLLINITEAVCFVKQKSRQFFLLTRFD